MEFFIALFLTIAVLGGMTYSDRKESFPFNWHKVACYSALIYPWMLGSCFAVLTVYRGVAGWWR